MRTPQAADDLAAEGVLAVPLDDRTAMAEAVGAAQAVLITAPPTSEGCPSLPALPRAIARSGAFPDWVGYLS